MSGKQVLMHGVNDKDLRLYLVKQVFEYLEFGKYAMLLLCLVPGVDFV